MRNFNVRRRLRVQAATAALGALMAGAALGAAPAQAAPKDALQYVALGDSYAAGQGAHPYSDLSCYLSKKSYPVIADRLPNIELTASAACSGNSTADVIASLPFTVDADTDLITVTAGGIDLGTNVVLAACISGTDPAGCAAAINTAAQKATDGTLYAAVATMLAAIHQAAPSATVVITGYPMLFESGAHPYADAANTVVVALNTAIELAAAATGSYYVPVADAFAGHGIGSPEPWINFNPANLADPANFHPNGQGYRHGYFASLMDSAAFAS